MGSVLMEIVECCPCLSLALSDAENSQDDVAVGLLLLMAEIQQLF